MTADRIHPGDSVDVKTYGPDGSIVSTYTSSNLHSIENAIDSAIDWERRDEHTTYNPADCVFVVRNLTADTESRYRFNAHGHLQHIV